ncbi:uncharacterized protein LOC125809453 [Solanum verrucosum]|uniref:uncharacterized protein LOC125809453 n=1 Tax=Solanum verrucosum TaxID=315347 RepID=UPI0020D05E1F|nr:uncharacterized protein LOC125809453 [Solanum verrucosum]
MVIGLPEILIPSRVCEECVVGKQHCSQFPKGKSWWAKDCLEMVHSDICGPIKPISNGEKSEAFGVFKSFKAHVENYTGKAIKTLRIDRGGKYCSKVFEDFCESNGIRRELTTAYTPQQNSKRLGVEENQLLITYDFLVALPMHIVSDEKRKKLDDKKIKSTPIVFDSEVEEVAEMPKSAENSSPIAAETLPTLAEISPTAETLPATLEETDAVAHSLRHASRKSTWMLDYKVPGINVNDDSITHLALFADCDPTTFESVVREEEWRKMIRC